MFTEAEKWHLKLHPDISLLEQKLVNGEILMTGLCWRKSHNLNASSWLLPQRYKNTWDWAYHPQGKVTKLEPIAEMSSPALLQKVRCGRSGSLMQQEMTRLKDELTEQNKKTEAEVMLIPSTLTQPLSSLSLYMDHCHRCLTCAVKDNSDRAHSRKWKGGYITEAAWCFKGVNSYIKQRSGTTSVTTSPARGSTCYCSRVKFRGKVQKMYSWQLGYIPPCRALSSEGFFNYRCTYVPAWDS